MEVAPQDRQGADHAETNDEDKKTYELHGLEELVNTVYSDNKDASFLALGADMASLGLNLNSSEALVASLVSPFFDEPPPKEAVEFFLPSCYYMNTPGFKMSLLQKFTVETLFYIFYTIVCDSLQGYAALRLIDCGWFYYCPYQKWFTPNQPLPAGGKGIEALKNAAIEDWNYFEPSTWAKQVHSGKLDPDLFMKFEDLAEYLKKQNFFCINDGGGIKPGADSRPVFDFEQVTP